MRLTRIGLLNIWNLHDATFCLRIVLICNHSHIQLFLAFTERDVRAIACG